LEKKLLLYANVNEVHKDTYSFYQERYEKFVEIIINKYNLDLNYMINRLERYYKNGISIENNKLVFNHNEISDISGQLYRQLYYSDSSKTFKRFLYIIQTKFNGNFNWWLDISFDDDGIKNHFLNEATNYIIENQNKTWISEFKKVNYKRYNWLPNINKVPEIFHNYSDLYFWFKHNRNNEVLNFIGNRLIRNLLHNVIISENYNIHSVKKNRILQILEACKDDYITTAYILTDNDIRLNCFLLRHQQYSLYGFLNLYNIDTSPHNLFDEEINYTKEWENMLADQLINLYFRHFYNLQYKEDFSNMIFNILNYLTKNYISQYNNDMYYKANKTLFLVMNKIVTTEIEILQYQKTTLFELVIDDLVNKQLEELKSNNSIDEKSYFLLSYYLKNINYKNNISNERNNKLVATIIDEITNNLKQLFSKQPNNFYIDFEFFNKIDFSILYELTDDKKIWLDLMNIDLIKYEWNRILDDKKGKTTLSSKDEREPREMVKLYFQILMMIYKHSNNTNVSEVINKIAIEFGIKFDLGIFLEYSFENDVLLDEYLEILNLFNDELFLEFLEVLKKQNNLKVFLQLYNYNILDSRKDTIHSYIKQIQANITEENISYFDIRESISYAINNGFQELANTLINFYKSKIKITNYRHKEKDFFELICKNELLDIYYKKISNEEKFNMLNDYTLPFDDKNWGVESKQIKCENYKSFIRAILFFDTEPDKTYKILERLIDEEINSLYLINMVNAYFKHYENDNYKKERFIEVLNKYSSFVQKISNYKKGLFDYQTLLYGYLTTEDEKKFVVLWTELPKKYQYDFRIFELRCQFLQQNKQIFKAKEYIKEYQSNKNTLSDDIAKIEKQLDDDIYIEVENKLNIKIDSNSLNLTLKEAKNYWLQIKDMTDGEHSQIFSKSKDLNDFIKNIMLNISIELLNRKINLSRSIEDGNTTLEIEDIINDWVTSLLEQKMNFLGWIVKDQTRGGSSSSGKNPGERDLEVYNNNNEKLFLFEAFRLFGLEASKINEHINKLDGYNADGCKTLVVMVYTYVDDFIRLCDEYKNLLSRRYYKGFDNLNSDNHTFNSIESNKANIKIFQEIRYKNNVEIHIYHFLLDFS
jgi:hypothetical protein